MKRVIKADPTAEEVRKMVEYYQDIIGAVDVDVSSSIASYLRCGLLTVLFSVTNMRQQVGCVTDPIVMVPPDEVRCRTEKVSFGISSRCSVD